jgi:hypothetical protein
MNHHKEIFTSKCRATLLEPGLLENKILDGHILEPDDVHELKKVNIDLTNDDNYAILVIFGHLSEVSQGARELIASKEFQRKTVAKALLVTNIGHRLLGNFYLSVNKPAIKTKLFTDRQSAIEWLRAELNKMRSNSEKDLSEKS